MDFNWNNIFVKDLEWSLALEIVLRTLIMFTLILVFLRLSGKKGIRQLSIFEVAIIIGLGSAAGDPMVNSDNAILPACLVFITILLFYRLVTYVAAKNEHFESILEGEPIYIIEDGMFALIETSDHTYAKDEFFAEMRQQNIEHVGQVQTAILETNGQVSFFFFDNEEVKPGLPILPKLYQQRSLLIPQSGQYACTNCGHVELLTSREATCSRCKETEWVQAIRTRRKT